MMQETVVERLRDHVADAHETTCGMSIPKCTCGYDARGNNLLLEAAARIEVALDALRSMAQDQTDMLPYKQIRIAYYALTMDRKP